MPKYTYKCPSCRKTLQKISSLDEAVSCDTCIVPMKRQLPNIASPEVGEIMDSYTGARWVQDQKEMLAERKAKYYWEVEVPRMVNSGIYSTETMLEKGWIYFNEKEEMVIRTKPPQQG